jgi:type I restriction enzyme, S subunit
LTVFDERSRPSLARDGSVLPEGWAEISLAEVIVHKIGGEWGEDAPGEGLIAVRVVRGTEYREWERNKGKTAAQRWLQSTHLASRELRPGDIVIEISGGGPEQPVGRILLIDEEAMLQEPLPSPPLICNNFCRLLRVHAALDPAFVHLALREKYLRGDVWEFQNQTTNLRNLQLDEYLEGTFLRVPPLPEQRRIVAAVEGLLASAAEARDSLHKAHGKLRKFRQILLAAAGEGWLTEDWRRGRSAAAPIAATLDGVFIERRKSFESEQGQAAMAGLRRPKAPFNLDPGALQVPDSLSLPELPEGWVFAPLQDLVETLQYGTSKRADRNLKDGVPVLRMGNIRDGKIDAGRSKLKLIDPATEDIPKFTLRRGDILFNRTNSPELVGKAAVFDLDGPVIFASYLVRITCDERLVLPDYLCGWINSPWGRRWARTVRTDCVSQSNINAAKLRTLPVPLPPLDEQREIVQRMKEAFAFADQVEEMAVQALAKTERLPRAILEQAMRGDLVPLEAEQARLGGIEYEPAAVLLDRVRADLRATAPDRQKRKSRRRFRGLSTEALLAMIRRISWGSVERTAEELVEAVAVRLKVPEPGPELQAKLWRHVEIAIERRILARKEDRLVAATPKIGRYDGEFLLSVLGQAMREGVSYDRKQLSRAVVSWLGYDQLTAAMLDRMDEIIREAVRRGLLAVEGDRYRFIHSKSS